MNCDWERATEPENGIWIARCRRHGCTHVAKSVAPLGKIVSPPCTGLPHAHEWREWLALFAEACGLDRAAATCRFIRWRVRGSRLEELPKELPRPVVPPLNAGPGTELHKLLAELGIQPDASCGCEAMRQKMDAWGPEGCRANMPEIIAHLEAAYQSTNWLTILRAAPLAAAQGVWSIEGLVDEAIRRAERRDYPFST